MLCISSCKITSPRKRDFTSKQVVMTTKLYLAIKIAKLVLWRLRLIFSWCQKICLLFYDTHTWRCKLKKFEFLILLNFLKNMQKRGSTLMQLFPYVHCLDSSLKGLRCDFCFKKLTLTIFKAFRFWVILVSFKFWRDKKLQQCSSCKYMHYCGRECQKKDWTPVHKHECARFKEIKSKKDLESDLVRLLIRILIKAAEVKWYC